MSKEDDYKNKTSRLGAFGLDSKIQGNEIGAKNQLQTVNENPAFSYKNGKNITREIYYVKAEHQIANADIYVSSTVHRSQLAKFLTHISRQNESKTGLADNIFLQSQLNNLLIVPIADDTGRAHFMTMVIYNGMIRLFDSKSALPFYTHPLERTAEKQALKKAQLGNVGKIVYANQSLLDFKSCGAFTQLFIQKILDGELNIDSLFAINMQEAKMACKTQLQYANFDKLFKQEENHNRAVLSFDDMNIKAMPIDDIGSSTSSQENPSSIKSIDSFFDTGDEAELLPGLPMLRQSQTLTWEIFENAPEEFFSPDTFTSAPTDTNITAIKHDPGPYGDYLIESTIEEKPESVDTTQQLPSAKQQAKTKNNDNLKFAGLCVVSGLFVAATIALLAATGAPVLAAVMAGAAIVGVVGGYGISKLKDCFFNRNKPDVPKDPNVSVYNNFSTMGL